MHIFEHALLDTLRLVPFLFVTYLAMEALEHKAGEKAEEVVRRAGAAGPAIGGVLGAVPQCGFSAAAATLYAGHVVTLGTLFAVFLSTSDEMLPIFIAEQVAPQTMFAILAAKVVIGMAVGFAIDAVMRVVRRSRKDPIAIHEMCERDHCHCEGEEGGILRSAVIHTLQVTVFILIVSLVLEALIEGVGEDALASFLSANPALSVLAASVVGLIPNCAASVVVTELYLEGALGAGAMLAGLLVSAGVGLLVLFRANRHLGQNLAIAVGLVVIGFVCGTVVNAAGISF